MKFTDEMLMAFADGELAEPARSQVERALRADPDIAARVAQFRAMRMRVYSAFAGVLDEPVPARLQPSHASAKVVHLDTLRAARQQARPKARWSWPQWGAMAASLVVGVLAGVLGFRSLQGEAELATMASRDGALVAQGRLAAALSQQLASNGPSGERVQIGISFRSKDGSYCRSFALGPSAGLACRNGAQWNIPVLTENAAGPSAAYRQAGSALPPAVLDAIDQRIDGAALDAASERAAQQRGWQRNS
jgi:hypothetical protein